jgi:lipoprotein LenA
MKKIFSITVILSMFIVIGCKKQEEPKKEGPIATKYAKYRVSIKKDKDLTKWLATLEKAEEVALLDEFDYTVKNKVAKLAKVKLASDEIGYVESKHLADKPIVFTEETSVFVRPTASSREYHTLPKGTIAFVVGEKGSWKEIWAGKVNGKWIVNKWVENGFSSEQGLLRDAIDFERALSLIEKKEEKAKEILQDLSEQTSIFSELAKKKIEELETAASNQDPEEPEQPEQSPQEPSDENTETE